MLFTIHSLLIFENRQRIDTEGWWAGAVTLEDLIGNFDHLLFFVIS